MESTKVSRPTPETLAAPTVADRAMLNRLVEQSGWNQISRDWEVFSTLGRIYAIRDDDHTIVASGAVLPLDSSAAWISMILVAPDLRGAGLGRAIFERCLAYTQELKRVALLDATPAGEALYAQYGFVTQWHLSRWYREASASLPPDAVQFSGISIEYDSRSVPVLSTMDAHALGLDRGTLLADLAGRPGSCVARSAEAMALVREGRFARHIGPLLSSSEDAAAHLLRHICSIETSALTIDVPENRASLHTQLESGGFKLQRGFARMALGSPVPSGLTAFIHAIAGPEYG